MAIPTGSQNKEGAWAYIRDQLSLDSKLSIGYEHGIPVNYEALRRISERELNSESQALLHKLLERTKYAKSYSDDDLRDIIISGAQSYLSGDKTLEDTVALIQSRANIYVAEQYG